MSNVAFGIKRFSGSRLLYDISSKVHFAIILAITSYMHVIGHAQSYQSRMIEVPAMQEELSFIQRKLNEIHPEPYHYISKQTFDERVEKMQSDLSSMTKEQWFIRLSTLISSLHDGHTTIRYDDNERTRYYQEGGKTLPFSLTMLDNGRMIIQDNFTSDSSLDSAEVYSVDGHPIEELIATMRPLTFGELDVFRNAQLANRFALFFRVMYGVTDSVTLEFTHNDLDLQTKKYACLNGWQFNEQWNKKYANKEVQTSEHMKFTLHGKRPIALLNLYDFNTYEDYQDSILHVFKTIKEQQIDTLIIDIRGNGGGQFDITEEINHYLMDTSWVLVSKAKVKMSDEFMKVFPGIISFFMPILPTKFLISTAAYFVSRNTRVEEIIKTVDTTTDAPIYDIYTRANKHFSEDYLFKGTVILLTDRRSYSMSGMFAAIMKDYKRAIIVGEETGGLANPHGAMTSVILPHSKFSFSLSTSRAYRPSGVFDDRGVIPDIHIPYTTLKQANTIDQCMSLIHDHSN